MGIKQLNKKKNNEIKRKLQFIEEDVAEEIEEEQEVMENNGDNEISKEAQIILNELNIARVLCGNDAVKRNQQVRKLKRWLRLRSHSSFPFTDEDFMRLWKGLYYCMYMADKPLPQEQLAEHIGKLLSAFGQRTDFSIMFFGAFLKTMQREWYGIDQWRMDKFYMLMRRMLRHMLRVLHSENWQTEHIELFNKTVESTILSERGCALAMTMHFMDIFLEELAKVTEGEIAGEKVSQMLMLYVEYLLKQRDNKLFHYCKKHIFFELLFQSGLGREYAEKYEAWQNMGFPGTIDDIEKVEDANVSDVEEKTEEEQVKHLDPRAGNVDVYIPELKFSVDPLIERLNYAILKIEMPLKRRKALSQLLEKFQSFKEGKFPLGVKKMPRFEGDVASRSVIIEEKVDKLEETEQQIFGTSRQLKKLNKRQRRKLLKSLSVQNLAVEEYEDFVAKTLSTNEDGEVSTKKLSNGWLEEEINDDETETDANEAAKKNSERKEKKKKRLLLLKKQREAKKLKRKVAKDNEVEVAKKVAKVEENSENDPWKAPLAEGEYEEFIPSRKVVVQKKNAEMVIDEKSVLRGKQVSIKKSVAISHHTPVKRVKIALNQNMAQKPSDYIKQIKSSPDVPYDATRKPGKGLLKPNSMPSPVDPFYAKRHSLNLKNPSFF